MVEYKCISCGEITKEPKSQSGTIQCSKCDHKVFLKIRQPVSRKVKAI